MTSCCMNFAIIIQWIYFTVWEKIKKNCHHYNTILSFYNIKTLQEEFAKKSNIPWIWRIIYWHKSPYMKKTRKKKQVCGAACFMAAEIKFSKDVCPASRVCSVAATVLVGFISCLYILSSNFRRCVTFNLFVKCQDWQFFKFFKFCNFDFILFWLGIWCESLEWVIMGRQGVSQNAGVLVVLVMLCCD